jgi:hypothetical protein
MKRKFRWKKHFIVDFFAKTERGEGGEKILVDS